MSRYPAASRIPLVGVGAGHRERPRPARRLVVLLGPGDEALDDLLGPVHPVVLDLARQTNIMSRPPGTSAPRTLRSAATGFAKNIVPKREKAMSKPPSSRRLHVGDREAHVRDAGALGILGARVNEARRDVEAEHLAGGPDQRRDLLRGVPEPAADVEHAITGRGRSSSSAASP